MKLRALFLLSLTLLPAIVLAQEAFVPLTSLPGIPETVTSNTLTDFLNNLYKICIGVAAALAVFQIMHAGIKFMTNKGSISENEQARSLLQGAVFGLILVLSPVILFSIINPKILELNFDTSRLESSFTGEQEPGINEELIDPDAPYTEDAFIKYELAILTNADVQARGPDHFMDEWMRNNCGNGNEHVPEDLRHLIEQYEQEEGDNDSCVSNGRTCVDGRQWWAKCEAISNDFLLYRRGNGAWQPLPDGESDRLVREFTSGCLRDEGRVVYKEDVVSISWGTVLETAVFGVRALMGRETSGRGCEADEHEHINNALSETDRNRYLEDNESQTRCLQARMMCHQP